MIPALVAMNLRWLDQAERLLRSLGDVEYTVAAGEHRAGSHMRHILEFYECFLEGCLIGHIDYDARRRDIQLETEREAALQRVAQTRARLAALTDAVDRLLQVRMEDAPAELGLQAFLDSSMARELQLLSSHTVHHFAILATGLRLLGIEVEPDFGVAPSTLRYRASRRQEAA